MIKIEYSEDINSTKDIRIFFSPRRYYTAEELLSGTLILGRRNSGKSYLLGKIIEQFERIPCIFVDPNEDNLNLAEKYDQIFYIVKDRDRSFELLRAMDDYRVSIYIGNTKHKMNQIFGILMRIIETRQKTGYARCFICDELQYVAETNFGQIKGKIILDRFMQTTRSRGWGFILASQRPVEIPSGARAQVSNFVIMRQEGTDLQWLKKNVLQGTRQEMNETIKIIRNQGQGDYISIGLPMHDLAEEVGISPELEREILG